MSTITQAKVERAIVHIVNHLKPNLSIKSQNELPLKSNQRLSGYFEDQITNALEDTALSQAVFDDDAVGPGMAANHCHTAINQPRKFITSSQELAEGLLTAMGTDGRIKPENSSLALCLYTLPPATEKYLAVLKLDPSEALIQKIERDASGNALWVNFEVREDAMPTSRERMQKAALILSQRSKAGHDLLLLDRQTSKEAADFFARKFLKAKPVLDAKKRTDRLYDALVAAHNRLTPVKPAPGKPHLELENAEEFLDEIDSVMRRSKIDTSTWLQSLALPEDAKQVIGNEIQRRLPVEKEFDLDPEYAQELNPKRRIKGNHNVVFEVDAANWSDVVEDERREIVNGENILYLSIRITNYQDVLKK